MKIMQKVAAIVCWMMASATVLAQQPFIIVQSTTSTQNSGLYDYLLPFYTKHSGIEVRVVAVGTGQAIRHARNGDADVLLVHSKPDEEQFVADGFGVRRYDLMYNDFVIVGPKNDPAQIRNALTVLEAFRKIAHEKAIFVSRADDSGTHKKELAIWKETGLSINSDTDQWYQETGAGMGATLMTGVGKQGYMLTDRATWVSFANKQNFSVVYEGDPELFNQYGIIIVNPKVYPHVKIDYAKNFVSWMLSKEGQESIAAFKVAGQQLFYPNAQ